MGASSASSASNASGPSRSSSSGGRRVPPLAIAIVLVAAALVATAWSTRSTTVDAFAAVRDGQALAVQQSVRADLADLGGPPTAADLDAIVREHKPDGLRYLAFLDGRGRVHVAAGTPTIERPPRLDRTGMHLEHVGGRVRIEVRGQLRRAWGNGRGALWLAMEIESPKAGALRSAATRTLAIGLIAAFMLLVVAAWLVRAELRRSAQERKRERERRLASLGEMSAVLAHEIRNPLASLKGNAQLLASSLPRGEKSRTKAERVVDEAIRLEKLTQDLLAFVRTGELVRRDVSPTKIAKDALAAHATTNRMPSSDRVPREPDATRTSESASLQLETEATRTPDSENLQLETEATRTPDSENLKLETEATRTGESDNLRLETEAEVALEVANAKLDVANAPLTWSLDAARIREVLINLVDNALAAGGPVEVRVAERAGRLVIEVRDHGPGVPAAERDKIFEPFHTGKTRGTGLGLAIAQRIVELHRGTITVDDAPGGGALFRIEIPR
ncbi:MAG TPA: HAMP domain-containing sensor histidine kinase [Kofleriaceae bacterium]|nr:HAMP domain-containing sensor histidine kinase [Kofleriaceae bacterium]